MNKHMGRIFSGAASTSPYSIGLLRFAMKYGLKDEDPSEYGPLSAQPARRAPDWPSAVDSAWGSWQTGTAGGQSSRKLARAPG